MNTTESLSIAASICPDKTAIVFEGKRYTFSQLNERATRLGNALLKLGIRKGDRVAILEVNCNQYVEAYFASAKIGAIYVPLNFRAKGNELTYMLNSAEASILLVSERYIGLVNSIKPNLASVRNLISIDTPHEGMLYYEDIVSSALADEVSAQVDEDDTTILVYTAGTTGFPKGVMLSHQSFSIYVLENVSPADPELVEKNILSTPLYHVAGFQAMLAAVYGGRTLVMERQFEPKEWMRLVEAEKVNRAMMVPTMLRQLMDHPDFGKRDLSSLKVITYGAAPMPLEVIKRAVDVFTGVSFINAFGQTETASTVTTLSPEDHVIAGSKEEKEKKLKRLSSIGKPMSDVQMRIVDEEGNELPARQVGEIVVWGPRVMAGYWKDQVRTEKTIDKNGWVHTGDMGYMDEDGYFFLAGRTTDMIIRGGENISPAEVELVLCSHCKVSEAAVIGVPDEEWGEVPMAVVVLKPGESAAPEELMEYCRANLAGYKRPRCVVFCEELPRNAMGKVLRRVLREQYARAPAPSGNVSEKVPQLEKEESERVSKILEGDVLSASRLMRGLEDEMPDAAEELRSLYTHTGRAHIVGVAGAPGAGKSTLLSSLISIFRKQDLTVGVVAVDPTSPFTGGALLGDRIRMQSHGIDKGVFIRSLATRGWKGGLAKATSNTVHVMDAMGKDIVFVEAVGSGQGEIDIAKVADTAVIILTPGMGDEIQMMKAGILEAADIFVINKADRDGADNLKVGLEAMLEMRGHAGGGWKPGIFLTEAIINKGTDRVAEDILKHKAFLVSSGELEKRRKDRARLELMMAVESYLLGQCMGRVNKDYVEKLVDDLAHRKTNPQAAALKIIDSSKG